MKKDLYLIYQYKIRKGFTIMTQAEPLISEIQRYWTDRCHSYSEENIAEMNSWKREAWRRQILDHAPKGDPLRILDIGTGPGFFAINLALAGHQVWAVDVTEHMLGHARLNADTCGAKVNFRLQNGDHLEFEDGSFDLVVNRNVLWNFEHPLQGLKEWKRVLRSGGRMIYFDCNHYLYLDNEDLARETNNARMEWEKNFPQQAHRIDAARRAREKDLEEIARTLPLSHVLRPKWDRKALNEIGMEVITIQEDIGKNVWNEDEQLHYRTAPMFMVCAQKP